MVITRTWVLHKVPSPGAPTLHTKRLRDKVSSADFLLERVDSESMMGLLDAIMNRREGPGSGATEVGELRLRPLSDYKTKGQICIIAEIFHPTTSSIFSLFGSSLRIHCGAHPRALQMMFITVELTIRTAFCGIDVYMPFTSFLS